MLQRNSKHERRENQMEKRHSDVDLRSTKRSDTLPQLLDRLAALEQRVAILEDKEIAPEVRPRLPNVKPLPPALKKSTETIYEAIDGRQKKPEKSGKFFDDQNCMFLALQLEEVEDFLKEQPCVDREEKKAKLCIIRSVISALKVKPLSTSSA
ncbi:unnamed protein product [Clavelina lepadiformis]|uniref:Uncharacterized protein n=1 Tax=Clavelina lepadiformis TaxID=159417 RepID=A0ABP0G927_CLALP